MSTYPLTVLMYHALFDRDGRCDNADPRYAVMPDVFARHLCVIKAAGLQASSVADLLEHGRSAHKVAITFDDGHVSNFAAAETIVASKGSADLFINPSMVGKSNFLDWSALSDLVKAGISVQSHGHTHRYFDELSDGEVEDELARSKSIIEDRIGKPVTLFAPPGGRLTRRVAPIAQRLGYKGICSSQVGVWQVSGTVWNIPRFAVLQSTSDAQLARWVAQDSGEITRLKVRHGMLTFAKALLGNRGYELVRRRLVKQSKVASPSA